MPDIVHRVSIDAPTDRVHELVATNKGVEQWWTNHPVGGEAGVGGRLLIGFDGRAEPSAVMAIVADTPDEVAWRCVEGPDQWRETVITFALKPSDDGGTTLLFRHAGWREIDEFMSGCSTNWGAYLTSLKTGAEGRGFAAYPAGEVSRWG